jgi:excisionase family DNA binding protein
MLSSASLLPSDEDTVTQARDYSADANPDLWTLTQAADFLDVSRKELLDLIRLGELRYVQRGIRFRIHRNELERYRERTAGPSLP